MPGSIIPSSFFSAFHRRLTGLSLDDLCEGTFVFHLSIVHIDTAIFFKMIVATIADQSKKKSHCDCPFMKNIST